MTDPKALARLMARQSDEALDYFGSLWAGYDDPANTETPHRQRTTMNKLLGFALFLGIPRRDAEGNPTPLGTMKTWQGRVGELRDLDVLQQGTRSLAEAAGADATPAAEAFLGQLAQEREALRLTLRRESQGIAGARVRIAAHEVRQLFAHVLGRLEMQRRFDHHTALDAVADEWKGALAALRDDQPDEKLHYFRIRNKRLRFVLELLNEAETSGTGEDAKGPWHRPAKLCREVHTTLGDLNDLSVLRGRLRLARARWQEKDRGLEPSADQLEAARMKRERQTLREWYALWPRLQDPEFLAVRR